MDSDRGGAIYGLLATIGFVVVVMAVIFAVCVSNVGSQPRSLGRVELIRYDRGGDDGGDCDWNGDCGNGQYGGYRGDQGGGGNGNRGRRGDRQDSGRDSCHSFCGNTIIVPDPTQKKEPPKDQQPQSLSCLVPVPWHCDQKPHSLTDPRQLPMVIAKIIKSGLDMGQLFATTTIHFVEDLFTALA